METIFLIIGLVVLTFLTACGIVANGIGRRTILSTTGQILYSGMFLVCLYMISCL